MARTLHVIARVRAKAGKEEALKAALSSLIAPSRREVACHQYDLLQNIADPRDFCFVERWDGERGLDAHAASEHVTRVGAAIADLVDVPPDVQRFNQV
ncbi:MAG: putative quinol monooxygenase [Vicinamibacterales bacterium]